MANESALTASPSSVRRPSSGSSAVRASACSSAWARPSRTRVAPAGVAVQGLARRTSTCPTADSSARMRWLTALAVTCSSRAAASKVP